MSSNTTKYLVQRTVEISGGRNGLRCYLVGALEGRVTHYTSSPRSISLPCHVCFVFFLYVLCLGCWWNRAGCQAAPGWVEKCQRMDLACLVYRCGSSRFLLSGGRHTHGSNRLVEPANRIWGCCALTAAASSPVTVGVDLVV